MRTFSVLLFSFFNLALGLGPAQAAPTPGPRFVRNDGQWDPEIRFRADVPGGFLLVKKASLRYVFFDTNALNARHQPKPDDRPAPALFDAQAIAITLEGANPDPRAEGRQPDGVPRSYFLGDRRASDVPAFSEVWLREVYPGIDLRLYAHQTTLKYEFVVAPGFSPATIRLRYDGADALRLENGNLHVAHRFGTLKELAPYSFQDTPNARSREITSRFLLEKNTVRFQIGTNYDPRQPLVIDPALIFSTFSGSVADNWGHTATYDAAGNLYSGGSALDVTGFPTTNGAFQVRGGGVWDVAILKFSPDGTRLLYATYLGGNETDVPHSLIVNSQGELVIFGTTSSNNFPTTATGYDRSFNGGQALNDNNAPVNGMDYARGSDLYVAKLSADGRRLTGSTYLGGAGNDGLNLNRSLSIRNYGDAYRGEVMTDSIGRVYVASVTASANFPLVNPTQTQRRGSYDGVVLRLSPDLARLEWSTLLGGNGYDAAYGLRVGASGSVYAVGVTASTDALAPSLGTNSGAFKRQSSGTEDGFVVRYTPVLELGNFSFLGSDDADVAALVDLDKDENVYVLGLSSAGRYPVTTGTYQNTGSGQFIQALDKTLSRSLFSTVVGSGRGSPDIVPTAFLVSECGNLYLSGWGGRTNSTLGLPLPSRSSTNGLPVTPDAFRSTTDGSNFYLMMLETGAKSLLYATFFGSNGTGPGDHVDGGTCRFDKRGFIYHAACACGSSASNFTTTPGAWSRINASDNCNNAAFKFDIDRLKVSFDVYQGNRKDSISGCPPLALRFVNTSEGGKTYLWTVQGPSGSTTATTPTELAQTLTVAGTYTITLKGTNLLSCQREAIATRTITVGIGSINVRPDTSVCAGQPVQLFASGALRYEWSPAATLSNPGIPNPVATTQATTTYTVRTVDAAGCIAQRNVTVTIDERFKPQLSLEKSEECGVPLSLKLGLLNPGTERYVWLLGNGDTLRGPQPDPYQYPKPGRYTITAQAFRGTCRLSTSEEVEIEPPLEVPNVITPNGDGRNDHLDLGRTGLKLDVYNRWGKAVLLTENYPNDWGPGVPNGTYYYLLTAPSGAKCKGWIQVMD